MSRIAYVNGVFTLQGTACVPMEDRGYHFADGAYEVIAHNAQGYFVDAAPHLNRLSDSLKALDIPFKRSRESMLITMHELMRRNGGGEGFLYLQVTRGVAARNHSLSYAPEPFLTMFVRHHRFKTPPPLFQVITTPDIRWKRNDIKATALLGNVLSRYKASAQGAQEAWLVGEDGFVREGSSTNAWIVDQTATLRTHPVDSIILNGIVRQRVLMLAHELNIPYKEKPFTVREAYSAKEAFLTSTTKGVYPVVGMDGSVIGDGKMGPLTNQLHTAYFEFQRTFPERAFKGPHDR